VLPEASAHISFILIHHKALDVRDHSRTGLQISNMRTTRISSRDITGMNLGVLMTHIMDGASSCRLTIQKNPHRGQWRVLNVWNYMLIAGIHVPSILMLMILIVGWKLAK